MTTATDIEVYLQGVSVNDVEAWLTKTFDQITTLNKKKGMPKGSYPFLIFWRGEQIKVIAFEEVEPNFTSVWFDSTDLPWQTDEQCALAAAQHFNCAARITAGSWQQNANPDAWYEIQPNGSKVSITWPTS